jgi:hypothetical protein
MSQDSLGKKTHLACAANIFWQADRIWRGSSEFDLRDAAKTLQQNRTFQEAFRIREWPHDTRSIQAYVHRFFRWLQLKPNLRAAYPTVILSQSDSIAFRQALWLDFVFGTPEAQRAVEGLQKMVAAKGSFEVSPRTHAEFCRWVDIPRTDNTRRGPFARWLEDAGLGFPVLGRSRAETSVLVTVPTADQISPEAFVYGLLLEFGAPPESGRVRAIEITSQRISLSLTAKALLLNERTIYVLLRRARGLGYIAGTRSGYSVDPTRFARALRSQTPFASQTWVREDRSEDDTLAADAVVELHDFPRDDCFATTGTPFDEPREIETTRRTKRETAFGARVGDAYKHRCCMSGRRFRAPSGKSWYGDAVHIVPNSGRSRDGSRVYGKPVIANGLFLDKFFHWCFDNGWLTLDASTKNRLPEYRVRIATAAADDFFQQESAALIELDNTRLTPDRLPDNPLLWPSLEALEWHRNNVFFG